MKTIIVLCIWGIACIGSGICIGYWLFEPAINIVYDDELPGLGGTPEHPDTTVNYVIPGTHSVKLEYLWYWRNHQPEPFSLRIPCHPTQQIIFP